MALHQKMREEGTTNIAYQIGRLHHWSNLEEVWLLEYVRSLLGLGCCSPLVLGLVRDKKERLDILLRGQVILSI
jgi:hypothetical protein